MKALLSALAFASVQLAFSQDLTKPVTYTTRATALHNVLDALTKQSGVKLYAANDMENEPLILRLNNVRLDTAMNKIALVFGATWEMKNDKSFVLDRTTFKADDDKEKGAQQRAAVIKDSIDAMLKRADEGGPLDEKGAEELISGLHQVSAAHNYENATNRAKYQALEARMPANRILARVLQTIGPKALADISLNDRVVYSTSPTSVQKSLYLDPEAFAEFNRTTVLLTKAYRKLIPASEAEDFWPISYPLDAPVKQGKAKLTIQQNNEGPGRLRMVLVLLDGAGKAVAQVNAVMGMDFRNYFDTVVETNTESQKLAQQGFEVGPIVREIEPHTSYTSGHLRALPDDIATMLVNPVQHDPLSFATSDIVLKEAELQGANAVCLATDDVEAKAYEGISNGRTSWGAFLLAERGLNQMSFEIANGWLIGKPFDPVWAQETRAPRQILGVVFNDAAQEGHVPIDDAVLLRRTLPRNSTVSLAGHQTNILIGTENIALMCNLDMLRLLGTLTPEQKEALKQGKLTTTFGALQPEQQQIVREFTYTSDGPVFSPNMNPGNSGSFSSEVTEAMPNGLTNDVVLHLTDVSSPAAYIASETTAGKHDETPVNDFKAGFSALLTQELHPELIPDSWKQPLSVGLGVSRLIRFDVQIGDELTKQGAILDSHRLSGPSMKPSQLLKLLSLDWQKTILDSERRYEDQRREEMQYGNTETNGGAAKPPTV